MMKEKDFLVSIVCPLPKDDKSAFPYLDKLRSFLEEHYEQYEIILISDFQKTGSDFQSYIQQKEGMRVLKLLQATDVDVQITAGLETAIGDVVVVCLPPFDPIEKIKDFVSVAKSGQIALGQRPESDDNLIRRLCKNAFYLFSKRFLSLEFPSSTTYFVALPRTVTTHFQRTKDRFRMLKVLTAQVGLPIKLIPYTPTKLDGRYYRSFYESLRLSFKIISSQSLRPLRFCTLISYSASIASIFYAIYVVNIWLFKADTAPGWGTISLFLCFITLIFGIVLGTLCEYLAQLITESQNRPMYNIGDEFVSKKSISNIEQVNVVEHAGSL